jgi:hypothetical protein
MGASKRLFEQIRNSAEEMTAQQRKYNDAKRATSRKKGSKFNTTKK